MCFQWDAAGDMKLKIATRLHVEKSQWRQKAVWQSPCCDTSVSCVVCLSISYSAGVMPKLARWSGQTTSEGRREPRVLGFCIRFCLKDLCAHSRASSDLCCRSGLATEWQLMESRCGSSCILPHPKQGNRLELMVANRTACFSCFTDLPTWGGLHFYCVTAGVLVTSWGQRCRGEWYWEYSCHQNNSLSL